MTQVMTQASSTPKVLAPGKGDRFQMLTHKMVVKIDRDATQNQWVMYEASDSLGNGAPLHTHPWEETFYMLSGELEVTIGRREVVAAAGASIHFPADIAHGFRVSSPEAKLLIILPGFADAFYREVGDRAIVLPDHLDEFLAVCDRHQVRIFNPA
ncbi:cupin domain-containing protein [Nodosilinea sp. E11]|uniref:cupin domain-containing protein n=1 Tax=Nodosilinea sp. E11 TaxID=3037479 RepID=UPI0029342AA6|nr:cupin domain-containing protein [Nodosilinea sp. E11]WOD41060.1 cupin domain-containing protein [Nodosilinea sp. E11]